MPTYSGFQAAMFGPGLQPLVALDAALDLVLGLALVPDQLDAVDAAVAGVDQVHVVDEAAEEAGAAGGIGADAVALQREVLLVGRMGGRQQRPLRQRRRAAASVRSALVMRHCMSSSVCWCLTGQADERPAAEPGRARSSKAEQAPRLGDQEADDQADR